jgi:hypothetical protein
VPIEEEEEEEEEEEAENGTLICEIIFQERNSDF